MSHGISTEQVVDALLKQIALDKQTPYWGEPPHRAALDGAEAWLESLRDWGGERPLPNLDLA